MKRSFDASRDIGANYIHTGSSNKRRNLQPDADPLSNFVIVVKEFKVKQQIPLRIISDSCSMSRMAKLFETTEVGANLFSAKLFIQRQYIATGEGRTLKEAKDDAHDKALKILSQRFYTIKIRLQHESRQVMTDEIPGAEETPGEAQTIPLPPTEVASLDTPVEGSSVGSKMLKMMGWSGGGLGKDGLGIAEPIRPSHVIGRKGLGFGSQDDRHLDQKGGKKRVKVPKVYTKFEESVICLINDFLEQSLEDDLVFSPEFTPDQRCMISQIGMKFQMKVKARGKGDSRYLVLSRKISAKELLDKLLNVRGVCEKYQVFPPGEAEF